MKLPKSFTTITPFSKMLALAMFIILPVCAFVWGMNYQATVDATKPQPVLIEYKLVHPTPTPIVSQTSNGSISCKTNADCSTGYFCTQAGPIRADSVIQKTCWKDGSAVPL
jgi:hypothetical protein